MLNFSPQTPETGVIPANPLANKTMHGFTASHTKNAHLTKRTSLYPKATITSIVSIAIGVKVQWAQAHACGDSEPLICGVCKHGNKLDRFRSFTNN